MRIDLEQVAELLAKRTPEIDVSINRALEDIDALPEPGAGMTDAEKYRLRDMFASEGTPLGAHHAKGGRWGDRYGETYLWEGVEVEVFWLRPKETGEVMMRFAARRISEGDAPEWVQQHQAEHTK